MYFLINELSFNGQFSNKYDAGLHMNTVKDIFKEIKYLTNLKIVTHQSILVREFYQGCTFGQWLQEYAKGSDKDVDFLRLLLSVVRGNCISKMLDLEFKNGLSSWKCYFNENDYYHSSLAGAAYYKGNLVRAC